MCTAATRVCVRWKDVTLGGQNTCNQTRENKNINDTNGPLHDRYDATMSTAKIREIHGDLRGIDREFVTSAKKSRILTNFPKLKKFVKIHTKIRQMPEWKLTVTQQDEQVSI